MGDCGGETVEVAAARIEPLDRRVHGAEQDQPGHVDVDGGRDLAVGLDLLRNLEDYDSDDADPFTAANHDQTDGFVVSAVYGSLAEKNSWLVGYWYAWIEAFAVHASYAEDDWERWGTANQARSSNFKGHELRYARAVSAKADVVARLFLIESITTVEDGNRLRVDLDVRF